MSKEGFIELEGTVEEVLRNATFRVKVNEEHTITAVISGRMRQNKIQILLGDQVTVEVSPYDLSKGRIIYRSK